MPGRTPVRRTPHPDYPTCAASLVPSRHGRDRNNDASLRIHLLKTYQQHVTAHKVISLHYIKDHEWLETDLYQSCSTQLTVLVVRSDVIVESVNARPRSAM